MTAQTEKQADPWSLYSNFGLVLLAGGALGLILRAIARFFTDLWHYHSWLCMGSGIAVAAPLLAWGMSYIWNRRVERDYEASIIGPEENAVYLGRDDVGKPVYLKQQFRTMHADVIGTTSAGKTESAILPWSIHDIECGNGLLIVDGKSDSSFLDKLYAYVVRTGREKDFRLFSLAHIDASHTFNPLMGGGTSEVVERVFSSFKFENEYYRNVQYRIFHLLVRLILSKNLTPTFMLVHRLLTDPDLLKAWVGDNKDELLNHELVKFLKESPKTRAEKISGLETHLGHFATGEYSVLFNSVTPSIRFDDALRSNHICYFQLPSMYLPFLAASTGKLVLQSFQSAVSKRHLGPQGNNRFFSCFLDDFQDYIYEGFGALLNKSRSANIGVVFSHQAIGDLNKVSPAFTNVVMTNTNIKCVMRTSDPDTSDYFARSFGTRKAEKTTERSKDTFFGQSKTGDGSVREVDQYIVHPNEIRTQGTGHGVVTIPHPKGVKIVRVAFSRREDLPAVPIPKVEKALPTLESLLKEAEGKEKKTETPKPNAATDQLE